MRRGIACALGIVVAVAAAPAVALADNLCVPDNTIPACGGQGANEPNIAAAVLNAKSGDTIFLGPKTFNETVDDMGKPVHFVGAGTTQTLIQPKGSPGMSLSGGSSVSNLTISLYNSTGNTGLLLAGTASNVTITATQPLSSTNNIGVALLSGGTFTHGTVTLPLTGGDATGYGGVVGTGTVSDSSITAAVGATSDSTANTPTLHRDRIVANQGVLAGSLPSSLDDSLIRTVSGTAPEVGLGMSASDISATITARHLTIVGGGTAASAGVQAVASGTIGPASTSVTLASSIIRGYVRSIAATAAPGPFPPDSAAVNVTLDHSFYDPATVATSASMTGPPSASATIAPDSHSGNLDPLFVNAAAGDFRLQAGSPAIDGANPGLAAGESTSDLDGNPRQIAGHNGDAAVSDIGAFEFIPRSPSVTASVAASSVPAGKAAGFRATGSDPSPGDGVSLRWTFDDGGSALGGSVTHAFAKAGRHRATVIATDLDGFSAGASVTVTVTGPSLSKLSLKPARFTAHAGTTIRYFDAQAAKTTFAVLRVRGRSAKVIGTFTHTDRAGKNAFHWSARIRRRPLAAGRYRLKAIPRNRAGAGAAVVVSFQVRRAPPGRNRHR